MRATSLLSPGAGGTLSPRVEQLNFCLNNSKLCQRVGLPIKLLSLASPSRHLDSNQKGGCVQTPAALEHLRLDLWNRFEGLQLDEDASPEDEWRELKDAVADASQAHLGKTRRCRRDWVTGETIALVEQARLARIQSAPKSPGTEKANNEGTTPGSQRLLEGNYGRDREGGGLR